MLLSLVYLAVRRLLRLLTEGDRPNAARDIEILVLRDQLRVLSRGRRLRLRPRSHSSYTGAGRLSPGWLHDGGRGLGCGGRGLHHHPGLVAVTPQPLPDPLPVNGNGTGSIAAGSRQDRKLPKFFHRNLRQRVRPWIVLVRQEQLGLDQQLARVGSKLLARDVYLISCKLMCDQDSLLDVRRCGAGPSFRDRPLLANQEDQHYRRMVSPRTKKNPPISHRRGPERPG